jgi:heavy metal sensor kinase
MPMPMPMRIRMDLTTRVTAFFLAALAVALAGFSTALILLARTYLQRQADERLESALATLVASIEFHQTALEWEPNERLVTLGQGLEADQVRWMVRDEVGTLVGRSRNLDPESPLCRLSQGETRERGAVRARFGGHPWRVIQRRVTPPGADREAGAAGPRPLPPYLHRALLLTAALDVSPAEAALATLVRSTVGLSIGLWLAAALAGRWLCRRALRPVTRMVEAAGTMSGDAPAERLPVAPTGDELEDLGDAFNGLLARLEESFLRQRRFTGDASHQLRTPLTAMLGQVEVALRRPRDPDEYRRVLALVRDQAAHLNQLVESLLFLSRADAESALPDLEALDLGSWHAAHRRVWAASPRAADIRVACGDGPHPVRVHPTLLAQLLENLVDNAAKYSTPGTPITIEVGRENGSGRVTLAVTDRGAGIDGAELEPIFEPFYRSPEARRTGTRGVGLGLSVAQRIAGSFGGSLTVASERGRGSRFVLQLPEAEGPDGEPAETSDGVERGASR